MKVEFRTVGTGLLVMGLLAGVAIAEHGPGKERGQREKPEIGKNKDGATGSPEYMEFRKAQQDRVKEFYDAQRASRQEVMQSVRNEADAHKALALVRTHAVAQQEKISSFHGAQWDREIQFRNGMLEKNNVDPEHREKIIKEMVARNETRKADATARYESILKKLDDLAVKADLTKEDIRSLQHKAEGQKGECVKKGQVMESKRERKECKPCVEPKRERKERKEGVKRERKEGKGQKPAEGAVQSAPDA